MNYEATMRELGISRGKLEAGFPAEIGSISAGRDTQNDWGVSQRIVPPPITEDLSHLIPPPPRTVKFNAMLHAKGLTVEEFARRFNYTRSYVRYRASTNRWTPELIEKLRTVFSQEEIDELLNRKPDAEATVARRRTNTKWDRP
jgi:hypothetical protein